MTERHYPQEDVRSLTELVADMKREVTSFVQTRVALFRSELKDGLNSVKEAVPLAGMAMVFLLTAYLLLTLALVGFVAVAFLPNPYAWAFALLIVGMVWLIGGGIMGFLAYNRIRAHGVFPKKTVEVLKADKLWLESEARSQV